MMLGAKSDKSAHGKNKTALRGIYILHGVSRFCF